MKFDLLSLCQIRARFRSISIAACSSSIWLLFFAGDIGLGQNSTKAVDKANLNIVRVLLTVHGLELSPSRIQPGAAQLWIENNTAILRPQLVISTIQSVGQREEAKTKTKVELLSNRRRTWNEVTLPVGNYIVSLEGAPEVQTRLIVAPKN